MRQRVRSKATRVLDLHDCVKCRIRRPLLTRDGGTNVQPFDAGVLLFSFGHHFHEFRQRTTAPTARIPKIIEIWVVVVVVVVLVMSVNHQKINHQPSTINHQPSNNNHQPSTINHQTTTIHPSQSDPNLSFPKLVGSSK